MRIGLNILDISAGQHLAARSIRKGIGNGWRRGVVVSVVGSLV